MSTVPKYEITAVGSSGAKPRAASQSLAFSMESVTNQGIPMKLVFLDSQSEESFSDAVLTFVVELVEHHSGRPSDLDRLPEGRPPGAKHLVRFDHTAGTIVPLTSEEIFGDQA